MPTVVEFLFKTFPLKLGGALLRPSYLQAIAIVFLIFLLTLTMARLRRLYVNWSLKGSLAMIFFGFVLALILEGFLILSGRTLFTEVIGWENAPKPISTALNMGRNRLVDVLGVNQEIPESQAANYSSQDIYSLYQTLSEDEKSSLKASVCGN